MNAWQIHPPGAKRLAHASRWSRGGLLVAAWSGGLMIGGCGCTGEWEVASGSPLQPVPIQPVPIQPVPILPVPPQGALSALASKGHFRIALPQPRVRAVSVVQRPNDVIVALAQSRADRGFRISLRRAEADAVQPELTEEWGHYDLEGPVNEIQLSAAQLGSGVALYLRMESGVFLSDDVEERLLRFGANGQLLPAFGDEPLAREGVPASCKLTNDGESVILACSSSVKTLQICAMASPCTAAVPIDPVLQITNPPSVVPTPDGIRVFYEVKTPQRLLRQAVFQRNTLTRLLERDLLELTRTERAGTYSVAARAAAVEDGFLIAFGLPRQFGVWGTDGTLLRLSAPDTATDTPEPVGALYRNYGEFVPQGGRLYIGENTWQEMNGGIGQKTRIFELDPETLSSHLLFTDYTNPVSLFVNAANKSIIIPAIGGLTFVSLGSSDPLERSTKNALPGLDRPQPSGVACTESECQVVLRHWVYPTPEEPGLTERSIWSVDRSTGAVSGPSARLRAANQLEQILSVRPEQTVLALRSTSEQKVKSLEILHGTANQRESLFIEAAPPIVAFPEGEALRIFSAIPSRQEALESRLLTESGLAAPERSNGSPTWRLYGCDGQYYAIDGTTAAGQFYIQRMDPAVSTVFSRIGTLPQLPGIHPGSAQCSDGRLYLAELKESESYLLPELPQSFSVHELDGPLLARVGLPENTRYASSFAQDGHLYVLWTPAAPGDTSGITIIHRDGDAQHFLLPLPAERDPSFWIDGQPELGSGELRVAWPALDNTPYLSLWQLP